MTLTTQENDQRDPLADTFPPVDRIPFTTRFDPDIKEQLDKVSERTGRSLNSLINEACANAMTEPGGVSLINQARRKMTPQGERGEQAWGAIAYLLAYLGADGDARRAWPWTQDFCPEGAVEDLSQAGALAAAEIDHYTGKAPR